MLAKPSLPALRALDAALYRCDSCGPRVTRHRRTNRRRVRDPREQTATQDENGKCARILFVVDVSLHERPRPLPQFTNRLLASRPDQSSLPTSPREGPAVLLTESHVEGREPVFARAFAHATEDRVSPRPTPGIERVQPSAKSAQAVLCSAADSSTRHSNSCTRGLSLPFEADMSPPSRQRKPSQISISRPRKPEYSACPGAW